MLQATGYSLGFEGTGLGKYGNGLGDIFLFKCFNLEDGYGIS